VGSTWTRWLSEPPVAVVSASRETSDVRSAGASLNANVTVAVVWARSRLARSIETATAGVTVSTVNGAVLPPNPAMSPGPCQLPAIIVTVASAMSMPGDAVKVAV
jgi:hypothetical protein